MNLLPTNENITCVQPAELHFDAAIRKFAPKSKTEMDEAFKPFADSVIIGKGKMPAQASGNKRLRVLVDERLQDYANAKFKRDKTYIVTNILHTVQELCPVGAFVKFDGERWWEVSDRISREKIACMFRDSLSGHYKSSNKNKVAKRRAQRALKRSAMAMLSPQETPIIQAILQQPPQAIMPDDQILRQETSVTALTRNSLFILEGLDLDLMGILDPVDKSVFDDDDEIFPATVSCDVSTDLPILGQHIGISVSMR